MNTVNKHVSHHLNIYKSELTVYLGLLFFKFWKFIGEVCKSSADVRVFSEIFQIIYYFFCSTPVIFYFKNHPLTKTLYS